MAEETLVDSDIKAGKNVIERLEKENFPFTAGFWLHYPDSDVWKLVISSDEAKKNPKQVYIDLGRLLSEAEESENLVDLSRIKVVTPDDPYVSVLSRVFRLEEISVARFSKNMYNGVYIDDAVIYKTTS